MWCEQQPISVCTCLGTYRVTVHQIWVSVNIFSFSFFFICFIIIFWLLKNDLVFHTLLGCCISIPLINAHCNVHWFIKSVITFWFNSRVGLQSFAYQKHAWHCEFDKNRSVLATHVAEVAWMHLFYEMHLFQFNHSFICRHTMHCNGIVQLTSHLHFVQSFHSKS